MTAASLDQALRLPAEGRAVFPCRDDKRPACPSGFKLASKHARAIREMWAKYPGPLVGVSTGAVSNLAVLDIDKQHDGGAWFAVNRHRLPETRTHRTRSGGLHLWFLHAPGLSCSVARIAAGIDVRAEGGYIIFWPAAGLAELRRGPLAPWPSWLAPAPKTPPAPPADVPWHRPAEHIVAQLAGLARSVATAREGCRNATLFWAANRAAELVTQGRLSHSHAVALLIEAASRAGLDPREARVTCASAFSRGGA